MSNQPTWNGLNDMKDQDLQQLLERSDVSKLSSHHPLHTIRKNLLINICFGLAIFLLYAYVLFIFRFWQVQICLGIVLLFSIWAIVEALRQYRHIPTGVSASHSVLPELKRQYHSIQFWMKAQLRIALFIYPISATGGFLLGGAIGSGNPVEAFMSKPAMWVILLVVLLILVPLCHLLAKWMFRISFGKHVDALKQNIDDLEREK